MEVRFLVYIDPAQKTGLFNAVVARVACVPQSINYNLSYFDTTTIRFLKRLLGFRAKEKKQLFEFNGVLFTPLHVRADVLHYLARVIGPLIPLVFHRDSKSILETIGSGQYILSAHWGITSGLLAHFICSQTKMKYVVTYHGSDINKLRRKGFWLKRLVLRSLAAAEMNIFVSKALLAEARSLGYEKNNSIVIHNGVDKEKFSRGVDRSRSVHIRSDFFKGSPVIGYVGDMRRVKGADYLPEICKEILAKEPNAKFLFAGDGKHLGNIKSSVPNDKVVVLGKIDPEDIVEVMSLLDVLMIPSRNEGLPLVLLEALASGASVVASKVGGIPEVLSGDYLVDPGHDFVERFSRKVVSVLCDDSQSELDDRLDWEFIRAQERQVYQVIECKTK